MKRCTLALVLILGGAAGLGCASARDLDASDAAGSLAVALELGALAHDVVGVRFDVVDAAADCDAPPLATETRTLEGEALPASLAGEAGAFRPFADALFVLESGEYRVCATPLTDAGAPSSRCVRADVAASIATGHTNEIVLVSHCSGAGSGGLDVVVALNDPPRITAVTLDPSKFITVCESLAIAVSAEDPNGDAISYTFALVAGPEGAHLRAAGPHATFFGPAGDYLVQVTAADVHGHPSSLEFPIHVSPATCAVPAEVQEILAAGCSPCHTTASSGGLRLATAEEAYANLVARNASAAACSERVLIVPGAPAESYLIAKLRNAAGICGLQMPRNRPPLPEEQIQAIEAWISRLPH